MPSFHLTFGQNYQFLKLEQSIHTTHHNIIHQITQSVDRHLEVEFSLFCNIEQE